MPTSSRRSRRAIGLYKKAKSLTEALRILSELARTGHIDPDVYNLFVTEQVYLRYVEHRLEAGKTRGVGVRAGSAESVTAQLSCCGGPGSEGDGYGSGVSSAAGAGRLRTTSNTAPPPSAFAAAMLPP